MAVLHPLIWARSCDECQEWLFNDDGKKTTRGGIPQRRPLGMLTPCHKCPKIAADQPVKHRSQANEMSAKNRQAYQHYRECAAVGHFPDDPIVRRNAAIIRDVLDAIRDGKTEELLMYLSLLFKSQRKGD